MLNLSSSSYSITHQRPTSSNLSLFDEDISLFVVVGKICAGKTALGRYASGHQLFQFIEASNIARMLANEFGLDAPNPLYLAVYFLNKKGPDIIARQIVQMYADSLESNSIVTGFRTIEEIQLIRDQYPNCKVVYIDASSRTRFERHLKRGRLGSINTFQKFEEHDRRQWEFGLLPVAKNLSDIVIENEGTIETYYGQVRALLSGNFREVLGISQVAETRSTLINTRVVRCLRALEKLGGIRSCPEIAKHTNRDSATDNPEHVERISPRHVNWVLKDIPELARRVDVKGDIVRYEILPAGRTYLRALGVQIE